MKEVLMALLAVLGLSFLQEGASDTVQAIGRGFNQKWRNFIKDANAIINQNSQRLADWKTLSENQKTNLLNSLITSSGLGQRAASIRREYNQIVKEDEDYTKKVTDANSRLAGKASEAERVVQRAESGIIGAAYADLNDPYIQMNMYTDQDAIPSKQNIEGGLQHAKI